MSWRISVARLPKSLNGSGGMLRQHWAKRHKAQKEWDALIWPLVACAAAPPKPPLRLIYTRRYARLPMDLDNAAASLKQPLDALVRSGAIEDDGPQIIAELVTRQVKVAKVAAQGITIELETIEGQEAA